jgi:hypothetical protein
MLELFWRVLLYFCLAWYSCVTLYVAVRGAVDIRTMLRSLSRAVDPDGPAEH